MNTTRNTLISALALAGALYGPSPALGAAPDAPAGQRVAAYRERLQSLATELKLTEEQKQQLQPLWQEQMPKLRALWQDRSHSAGEKLAKFKALQQALEPKLKRVLTAEQFETWQRQRSAPGRDGFQHPLKALNLSAAQKEKLMPLWQKQAQKLRELRGDTSLSPREKLAKVSAMQAALEPRLKQVLTAEQFEQWQQQRGKMREQAQRRWQRSQPQ
jgi:hypothetical protein